MPLFSRGAAFLGALAFTGVSFYYTGNFWISQNSDLVNAQPSASVTQNTTRKKISLVVPDLPICTLYNSTTDLYQTNSSYIDSLPKCTFNSTYTMLPPPQDKPSWSFTLEFRNIVINFQSKVTFNLFLKLKHHRLYRTLLYTPKRIFCRIWNTARRNVFPQGMQT